MNCGVSSSSVLVVAVSASLVALGIESYVLTVAYPLFAVVGDAEFRAMHALHSERITWTIGPALLGAFGANALLAAAPPPGAPRWLPIVAAIAGGAVLGITAFVQVPLHARLGETGRDLALIRTLNANEPWRAAATLVQAAADVAMLALALRR